MTKPITLSPFGPKICGWKMPQNLIDEMNKDCEKVTSTTEINQYDYSNELIGQIKKQAQFSFRRDLGNVHINWFLDRVEDYLIELNRPNTKLKIQNYWYNRTMESKEYNPQHVHPSSMLTSVGYLKLPSNFKSELSKPQKNGIGGGLELFYGERTDFCTTMMTLIPEVGDFYIFPAMLRHSVYPMPNTITEERRSFSINFA